MRITSEQLRELLERATENFSAEEIGSKRHHEKCAAIEQVKKEFSDLAAEVLELRELLARIVRAANESIDDPKLLMIRAETIDNAKEFLAETTTTEAKQAEN